MLSQRRHKLVIVLLVALAAYGLFAYWWVTTHGKQLLQEQVQSQFNMALQFESMAFNPYTFNAQLLASQLTDSNQQTWLTAESIAIDFDPLHLLWGQWQFDDLTLTKPVIQLTTDQAGQLKVPALPARQQSTTENPLDWSINDIHIEAGQLNLKADNVSQDFTLGIKHISFQQAGLSSSDEEHAMQFTITTRNDEKIHFSGLLNLAQGYLAGQIKLTDWQATTINNMLPDSTELSISHGVVQTEGQIDWDFSTKPSITLQQTVVENWAMTQPGEWSVERLNAQINHAVIDIQNLAIRADNITSEQGHWSISSQTPAQTIETDIYDPHPSPGMQLAVDLVQAQDWHLEWHHPTLSAPLELAIPVIELTDFDNRGPSASFRAEALYVNGDRLHATGIINTAPLTIQAQLQATNWSLDGWSQLISQPLGVASVAGILTSEQQLEYSPTGFNLQGQLTIHQLLLKDQSGVALAAIEEVRVGSSTLNSQERTLWLDQIEMTQGSGSLPEVGNRLEVQPTSAKAASDASTLPPWQIILGQKE